MEWIVTRALGLVGRQDRIARINLIRTIGAILPITRSYIGPYNFGVSKDDVIWWNVKEEGVFAKVIIVEEPQYFSIQTEDEIKRIREKEELKNDPLNNDKGYWDSEYDKLNKAQHKNKFVTFMLLKTRTIEVIEQPFLIPRFGREVWVKLDTQDNIAKYFLWKEKGLAFNFIQKEDQGEISPRVRECVRRLYGDDKVIYNNLLTNIVRDHDGNELEVSYEIGNIDLDHTVPKKIGGPGWIIQNMVPMWMSRNRSLGATVPLSLIKVASRYLKYPIKTLSKNEWEYFCDDWNNVIKIWGKSENLWQIKLEKEYMAIYITNFIKDQEEMIQRRFYYEVVLEEYGEIIERIYRAAKIDNPNFYEDIFEVLDTKIITENGTLTIKYNN